MLSIDNRLLACAEFVTENGVVCDVGTDHAYLAAYLVLTKKCNTVIATDINDGPILSAGRTLRKYGILNQVKLIKSDGLTEVPSDNITDVVIAGMGAELICEIISKADWLKNAINLVLQPMTHVPYLRKWIYSNGFEIIAEKAVKNDHYFYSVIKVKYSGKCMEIDSVTENIGKIDLKDEISRAYAFKQIERLETAGFGMEKSNQENAVNILTTAKKIRYLLEGLS